MWLDLIVIVVIALFGFLGLRRGVLRSLLGAFGWVLAIIIPILINSYCVNFIKEYTSFYSMYRQHVYEVCMEFITKYTGGIPGSVPGAFGEALDSAAENVIDEAADKIAEPSFNVIVLIALILILKLFIFLIVLIFTSDKSTTFPGGIDGFTGMVIGAAQGVIIILVVLALIMPISFIISPDFYDFINEAMGRSLFTELIYINNPILQFVEGFVPDEFLPSNIVNSDDYDYDMKEWDSLV